MQISLQILKGSGIWIFWLYDFAGELAELNFIEWTYLSHTARCWYKGILALDSSTAKGSKGIKGWQVAGVDKQLLTSVL